MTRCMLPVQLALVLLLVFSLVGASGCATNYKDFEAFVKRPTPAAGGKPYVIEPPDTILIVSPETPEIDQQALTLRPDGYVTVALLGDIQAAGKTPTQLASEIQEMVLRYYQDANVQVQVANFASKRYYMAGETSAGPKPYTGKDFVLDAVLGAGVPRTAWPEKLVVIRPNEKGELIRRMTIDFNHMIQTGDLQHNALLEEGDILFMPINPLAAVGVAVQNLLSPVSPVIQTMQTPARVGGAF